MTCGRGQPPTGNSAALVTSPVPDPQYPPKLGKDTFLSGDGMVRSFAFDGEAR